MSSWSRSSWREKKVSYIPHYPEEDHLRLLENKLKTYPPLIFAGEVRQLKSELSKVSLGKSYLIQGGDCAETFQEFNTLNIRDTFRVLLQMALIFTFVGEKPTLRIGRVAGQFAKPRSNETEKVNGVEMLTYRGDIINSIEPTLSARTPNPDRMIQAYYQAAATLNLLRAFASGGYADLYQAGKWLLEFVGSSAVREKYEQLAGHIHKTLTVMRAYAENDSLADNKRVDFYSSHEALFLPYEESLTRVDSLSGETVATSAHMLWLGERTRDINNAHVEYLRGIINPIGIKCGPTVDSLELEKIIKVLNPSNESGKIVLILRAGISKAERVYSKLIREMRTTGLDLVWTVDPMHGNPRQDVTGTKTRYFSDILTECKIFIDVCHAEKIHPGGFHLEMTGKNVTECLGGSDVVDDLALSYETGCDPRLNASQALELSFALAEYLNRS